MESSQPGISQIFFNAGRGYNEQDSYSITIADGKQQYVFPLTWKAIKKLRFDPINVTATVQIKDARIENKQGNIIKQFSAQSFRSVQQIAQMDTMAGTVIVHTIQDANDPVLEIEDSAIKNPAGWRDYIMERGWIIAVYSLISFIFLSGLIYFVIFDKGRQYIIHGIRSFKIYLTENPKKSLVFYFWFFTAMLLGIKLWLIGTYGNATPFWDQWDTEAAAIYKSYLEGTLVWTDLITPHNEHRILTERLLALAILKSNGIWNPLLQMVVNAVLHIFTLVVCIILIMRVIGRNCLPILILFSLVLFGIPSGWENTLMGCESLFYFVLLFSIMGLWLTVTQEPLSVYWWSGVVCGILAFFSLASGIVAFAAAVISGLIFYAMRLRKTCSQLLAVVILSGLFTLGVAMTPTIAHHAALKASTLPQFLDAMMHVFGWPISSNAFGALIRNLPALVFLGVMLWKRPPADDRKWFLLALAVWSFGQDVSIAYGRAVGNLASRYLDLFTVGILINFACLISIAQEHISKQKGWTTLCVSFWTLTVLISLGLYAGKHVPADLAARRDTAIAQEINTRNYLLTGDFSHLKDKPFFHVPYPNSERLALILESPVIRSILPTNLRSPLAHTSIESEPDNVFVPDGYYPTTPKRNGMTLGSYGVLGNEATGEARIRFDANRQSNLLAIPVAGYPLSNGINVEVEQNYKKIRVSIKTNPKESWDMAYFRVENGAFSIHITDSSTTAWLAVGAPFVTGRLDAFINDLLSSYFMFILIGFVPVVVLLTQCGLTNHEKNL